MKENGFAQMIQILKLPPSLSIHPSNGSILQCWNTYLIATTHGWPENPSLTPQSLMPLTHSSPPYISSQNSLNLKSTLSLVSPRSTNKKKTKFLASTQTDIEIISISISDLEKLVAENSYFLPSYEVRKYLKNIVDLKQSLDDVTSRIIPKRKFSLKNKLSKKPTNSVQNDTDAKKNQNA
ncbi:Tubulin-folding cofactor C [Forsythia ovata]|uniref:Tubulin-folding cofactor C n=1 Tax=Forsythia ovata TaxID=205694 RepID=A0ABD1RMS8_9LAMI